MTARDLLGLKADIVDVVSSGAPAYASSFEPCHPVGTDAARTFADGVATRNPDPEALAIIRGGAARVVQVSDQEIAEAMRIYFEDIHNVVEGAAAAPLAALMKERVSMSGKRVGLIQLHGLKQAVETATYMEYDWHHRTVDGSTIVKAVA